MATQYDVPAQKKHKAALRKPAQQSSPQFFPATPALPQLGAVLQRAYAAPSSLTPAEVEALQHRVGMRAMQRILAGQAPARASSSPSIAVQPKLKVRPTGDRYEQEADRVADQMVRHMHAPALPVSGPPLAQRTLYRSTAQRSIRRDDPLRAGGLTAPDFDSEVRREAGQGEPLDAGVRTAMEPLLGADLGHVQVHQDGTADKLSRSIHARAFTTGRDLFFRAGEYQPRSRAGQRLIAHELTHVVQQGAAQTDVVQRDDDEEDDGDRKEAISTVLELMGTGSNLGGIVSAQGVSNSGDTFARGTRGPLAENLANRETDLMGLGASDLLGGLGGMTGNIMGGIGSASTLLDEDAGKVDKTKAGFDLSGNILGLLAGGGQAVGGIMDMAGRGATTASGEAVHKSVFGLSTPHSGDPKILGDIWGAGAGLFSTVGKGIGGVKQGIGGFKSAFGKHGKMKERGLRSQLFGVGRGARTMADIGASAATTSRGIASLVGQFQNGGQILSGSTAATVANTAGYAAAGLGTGVGAAQMLAGGYKMFKAGRRRSKLTERMEAADAQTTKANMLAARYSHPSKNASDQKRQQDFALRDQFGRFATEGSTNKAAFAHLHEIQKKKQVRGGIDAALGAAGVLGGALTLSGYGALPGAVIAGSAGLFKLGQLGVRNFKQAMRDRTAKKLAASSGDVSQLPWYLRGRKGKTLYDTSKTSEKKAARNKQTMQAILAMEGDNRKVGLDALGLSDMQLNKGIYQNASMTAGVDDVAMNKEKAERLKKLQKKKSRAQKKKGFDANAWQTKESDLQNMTPAQLARLMQEERMLKALAKR